MNNSAPRALNITPFRNISLFPLQIRPLTNMSALCWREERGEVFQLCVSTEQQPSDLRNEADAEVPRTAAPQVATGGSTSRSVPVRAHVKMSNRTAGRRRPELSAGPQLIPDPELHLAAVFMVLMPFGGFKFRYGTCYLSFYLVKWTKRS